MASLNFFLQMKMQQAIVGGPMLPPTNLWSDRTLHLNAVQVTRVVMSLQNFLKSAKGGQTDKA